MTKTKTSIYRRLPAPVLMSSLRHEHTNAVLEQTLQLLAKHLPGTQEDIQKLVQNSNQHSANLRDQENELILQGHGPRAAALSERLRTDADLKAFEVQLPVRYENPVKAEEVMGLINDYMTVDLVEHGQKASVLPSAEIFGERFHDITNAQDTDLVSVDDGAYLIQTEKFAVFTLRITIDAKTLFIFSSHTGAQLVTYHDIEGIWLPHTCWHYADNDTVVAKVREFFTAANVHAPQAAELARFGKQVIKAIADPAQAEALKEMVSQKDDGVYVRLDKIYTLVLNGNDVEVRSTRSDLRWESLTSFTRRHLLDIAMRTVAQMSQSVAPAPKKTAKKTAKSAAK